MRKNCGVLCGPITRMDLDMLKKFPDAFWQNVTEIASNAFVDNFALEEIKIPKTVKKIGRGAFFGCRNLRNVWFENGCEEIAEFAFGGCKALENATFADTIVRIGEGAFSDCVCLKQIVLPKNLREIAPQTFQNCKSLFFAKLNNGLRNIGCSAFMGCESLKNTNIPSSVKCVGDCAYLDCINLKKVLIGQNVAEIGNSAFGRCRSVEEFVFPLGIKRIDAHAIEGMSNEKIFFVECENDCFVKLNLNNLFYYSEVKPNHSINSTQLNLLREKLHKILESKKKLNVCHKTLDKDERL